MKSSFLNGARAMGGRAASRVVRVVRVVRFDGKVPRAIFSLPVIVVGLWWLLSFALYAFGWPIEYSRQNLLGVTLLVLGTLVLTVAAFTFVTRRSSQRIIPAEEKHPSRYMLAGLLVSIALLIPFSEYYTGYHLWEVGQALANQGEAFLLSSERIAEGTGARAWVVAVQTLAAPLTLCVVPYFALAWFERRQHLTLFLLSAAVPTLQSILGGRDFQLVTTGVLIGCVWLVSRVRRRIFFTWRDALFLVGGGILFLIAFGARKMSRNATLVDLCAPGADSCTVNPGLWDYIVVSFASYASHSFEGLGRALNGEWAFGGGIAHSPALSGVFESVFGWHGPTVITDQLEQFGWHATHYWSTGLAWLANDIPWALVPIAVALQGLLLAASWRSALRHGDWLSLSVFSYSWLSLFFMMQNLQLALSGPTQLGYIALVAAYVFRALLSRRTTNGAELRTPDPSGESLIDS